MLTYLLDANNGRLYEQLYEQMKQDILQGVLKAGERLPSKRKLAEHLGVSVVTVETAYGKAGIFCIPGRASPAPPCAKTVYFNGRPGA